MPATAVRAACRKYAQKYLDLQRTQFKRIGVFGRFERPYATMTPQYESVVLSTFFSFYETGFVYKGLRAVYWCMHDETALAEAEVEYENHTSDTVFVKYALKDDPKQIDPALAGSLRRDCQNCALLLREARFLREFQPFFRPLKV